MNLLRKKRYSNSQPPSRSVSLPPDDIMTFWQDVNRQSKETVCVIQRARTASYKTNKNYYIHLMKSSSLPPPPSPLLTPRPTCTFCAECIRWLSPQCSRWRGGRAGWAGGWVATHEEMLMDDRLMKICWLNAEGMTARPRARLPSPPACLTAAVECVAICHITLDHYE